MHSPCKRLFLYGACHCRITPIRAIGVLGIELFADNRAPATRPMAIDKLTVRVNFTSMEVSVISIWIIMTGTPLSGMGIGMRGCIVVAAGILMATDYSS